MSLPPNPVTTMAAASSEQDLESEKTNDEISDLVGDLHAHLAWRGSRGGQRVPAPLPSALSIDADSVPAVPAVGAAPAAELLTPAPQLAGPVDLDSIREELGDCRRCKLASCRKNLVFGVGNPAAELVFVGEGPGGEEDERGEPFVGKAGQLLDKMIEAMRYRREDVYICNVVKCRPPNNRDPQPEEVAACEPFLKAQLAVIRPKVIVGLGRFAVQCLLGDPGARITKVRGQWSRYGETDLMPTFHPAYLLRNDGAKKDAWTDLKAVMTRLGRPLK